jgi:hypothetical protein
MLRKCNSLERGSVGACQRKSPSWSQLLFALLFPWLLDPAWCPAISSGRSTRGLSPPAPRCRWRTCRPGSGTRSSGRLKSPMVGSPIRRSLHGSATGSSRRAGQRDWQEDGKGLQLFETLTGSGEDPTLASFARTTESDGCITFLKVGGTSWQPPGGRQQRTPRGFPLRSSWGCLVGC